MERITTYTAIPDLFGPGKPGFTDGDPGITPGTELNADWFNTVQEEIANAVEDAGLSLHPTERTQLSQAIGIRIGQVLDGHNQEADPHDQYILKQQKGVPEGVATLGVDGLVPLAQLPPAIATDEELAASLAAHVDPLTDPHPQYLTTAEGDTAIAAAIEAHEEATDPHPQYINTSELDSVLNARRGLSYFFGQI